jgi:hypothetical protein
VPLALGHPEQSRVRIGRREFPANAVTEVQGMFAESSAHNSQVGYIIFVNDPKREKRYRGKVTIKLPYVKARTAAELQTIIQIIPQFDIPDAVKASITKKRNRSFQPAGRPS